MNLVIFGIENPQVRALGELAEYERRQVGFEQFINDCIYNEDLDILVEEIEYDLEETLDRSEEIRDVLLELGALDLTQRLGEVNDWILQVLKDLNSVSIFDLENEDTLSELSKVLHAAFELNIYFLQIEDKIRIRIAEDEAIEAE
jgi:hypothetical protein